MLLCRCSSLHTAPAQDARCALPNMPRQRAELHPQGVRCLRHHSRQTHEIDLGALGP